MTSTKHESFWYTLGGVLLASYAGYYYWTHYGGAPASLSLMRTRQVLQEIKHQMLLACSNLSLTIAKSMKSNANSQASPAQLMDYFRKEISTIYKEKENQILEKLDVNVEEYAAGLNKYYQDEKVALNVKEILQIMDRTSKGEPLDFSVPDEVFITHSADSLKNIYIDVALFVLTTLTHKIKEETAKNPSFDCNDELCFKNTVKQLKLFDSKALLLKERGFDDKWGCPNEMLFKAIQTVKRQNKAFHDQMIKMEKVYEELTTKVKTSGNNIKDGELRVSFHNLLNAQIIKPQQLPIKRLTESKHKNQEMPTMPSLHRNLSMQPKHNTVNQEDIDLEKMFMHELSTRTAAKVQPAPKRQDYEYIAPKPQTSTVKQEPTVFILQNNKPIPHQESKPIPHQQHASVPHQESKQAEVVEQLFILKQQNEIIPEQQKQEKHEQTNNVEQKQKKDTSNNESDQRQPGIEKIQTNTDQPAKKQQQVQQKKAEETQITQANNQQKDVESQDKNQDQKNVAKVQISNEQQNNQQQQVQQKTSKQQIDEQTKSLNKSQKDQQQPSQQNKLDEHNKSQEEDKE